MQFILLNFDNATLWSKRQT